MNINNNNSFTAITGQPVLASMPS